LENDLIENRDRAAKEGDLKHGTDRLDFDKRIQDAIDLNLLDICEKKERAEAQVKELQSQVDSKQKRIHDMEFELYQLKKEKRERSKRLEELEKETVEKDTEIERLLDLLYGADTATQAYKADRLKAQLKVQPIETKLQRYKSVPKFKYPNHYLKETEEVWQTN
jgi:chromosome segregation ATPase